MKSFRVIAAILLVVIAITVSFIMIVLRNIESSNKCVYETILVAKSPDGVRDEILRSESCGGGPFGNSYEYKIVEIRDSRRIKMDDTTVFLTFYSPPRLMWVGANHLIITLKTAAPAETLIKKFDDVQITYELADELQKNRYISDIDARRQRIAEDITKMGDVSKDANKEALATVDKTIALQKEMYFKFLEWARENVTNLDSSK